MKDYKKCLTASLILNIINYLEKKGISADSLKEDEKEFIKISLKLKNNKDLKVKGILFLLKKLIRLRQV